MAPNYTDDVLDLLRRVKSKAVRTQRAAIVRSFFIKRTSKRKGALTVLKKLEMELRFWRTFIQYPQIPLPEDFSEKITKKAKLIVKMLRLVFGGIRNEYNNLVVERLVSQLLEYNEGNSLRYNHELNDSEYMDYLGKNLNDIYESQIVQEKYFLKQVKIIQKKIFFRDLYACEIKRYVDHEKLEGLKTRIQFMVENVGQFYLALWANEDQGNAESEEVCDDSNFVEVYDDAESNEDEDDRNDDILSRPPYLLALIVLVQLEMQKIFLIELKVSKFSRSRTFKYQKLPKDFSHHLHSLLVYLRNKMLETFSNDVSAQNIGVAIEFLLLFLADVPNNVIMGKMLNEVLEKVGALVGDVLHLNIL